MTRGLRSIGLVAVWLAIPVGGLALGQSSDALKDRVAQLVAKLDADKEDAREAAGKALVGLGPRILPMLEEAEKSGPASRKDRLAKIRAALAEAAEQITPGASRVTIQGKGIRLTEAIKLLSTKTGNTINDLREQQGGQESNPSLDLEIVDKPFFEALDIIAEKAAISTTTATADGSIGLTAGASSGAPMMGRSPFVAYSGPFRIQLLEIAAVRDFATGTGTANARLEVAWEPRLRPMLLSLKAEGIQVVDDREKAVPPAVKDESGDGALSPENPSTELNINLAAPERGAKELKSLRVKAEVTVPAGLKTFRFKNIGEKGVVQKEGDIAVTLESTVVEEATWKVTVLVAYPGGGPAFDSYRQGLFNNRIWLQKADGSRFEQNGGSNNTGSDDGKLGFEHLFVDVPGKPSDYGLVYETPSRVIAVPLEFEFKKVPLP